MKDPLAARCPSWGHCSCTADYPYRPDPDFSYLFVITGHLPSLIIDTRAGCSETIIQTECFT